MSYVSCHCYMCTSRHYRRCDSWVDVVSFLASPLQARTSERLETYVWSYAWRYNNPPTPADRKGERVREERLKAATATVAAAAAYSRSRAVGNCFLEAVQHAAAAVAATQVTVAAEAAATAVGSRMCRKMLLLCGFRRHVREFFGAVLGFARLSGAWCFPAGRCFF